MSRRAWAVSEEPVIDSGVTTSRMAFVSMFDGDGNVDVVKRPTLMLQHRVPY